VEHQNTLEHKMEDSPINTARHEDANAGIDEIWGMLPPRAYLPKSDRHLFSALRKNRQLKQKKKWIQDANQDIGLQPEARFQIASSILPKHAPNIFLKDRHSKILRANPSSQTQKTPKKGHSCHETEYQQAAEVVRKR
jgi:hypothetical protein